MQKRIQISLELYYLMKDYIEDHYDADDSVRYYKIRKGIEEKEMASLRRGLYSEYKSNGNEEARKAYLELTGIRPDFIS